MDHQVLVHAKTIDNFMIKFYKLPENLPINEIFSEEKDIKNIQEKINNYELDYFVAKVTAEKFGVVLATEYLGAVIEKNDIDFIENEYYLDMVSTVIENAKLMIKKLCNN